MIADFESSAAGLPAGPAPAPTRYFADGGSFWKFAPDAAPVMRLAKYTDGWSESIFTSLEEFLADSGEAREITEEEAEP